MKKTLLIPGLLAVAVASGVVSARFLTPSSPNPRKSDVRSTAGQTTQAQTAGELSATETKSPSAAASKRSATADSPPSPSGPSSAKRMLNSLKDRNASPSSRPPSATGAGTSQVAVNSTGAAASVGGGGGAISSGGQSGGLSAPAGGTSGSNGTPNSEGASADGGVPQEASAPETGTSTPGQESSEIVLEVPAGAIVPAAFVDNTPRTPQQQKMLDQIAAEFDQNVSTVDPGVTETENWDTARQIADQRYLTLFGYQAYNQYHLQAAKEALKEKKTVAPQALPEP